MVIPNSLNVVLDHLRRRRTHLIILLAAVSGVFTLFTAFSAARTTAVSAAAGSPVSLGEIVIEADVVSAVDSMEVLWLARAIYSETKDPHEQEMVAWVVRNRVETGYRGKDRYEDVVLDPWQFSAFNRNSPKRTHYASLAPTSRAPGFGRAMRIADRVAHADSLRRPFSATTRHFYSEQSMVGRRHPNWAHNQRPVPLQRQIDPRRFRFFADIS